MANKQITTVDTVELKSNELFFINQNNAIKQATKADVIKNIVNSFSDESIAEDVKKNLDLGLVAEDNIVPIEHGGTGAANATTARNNLGLGDVATENVVPVEKGGTGATNGAEALANMFAAGTTVLSANQYGDSFPPSPVTGQIFFLKLT